MNFDVDSLPYTELQRLAKQQNIRANQKAATLRNKLRKLLSQTLPVEILRCSLSPITAAAGGNFQPDACLDSAQLSKQPNPGEPHPPEHEHMAGSRSSGQKNDSMQCISLSVEHSLNVTYEIVCPQVESTYSPIIREASSGGTSEATNFVEVHKQPACLSDIKSPPKAVPKLFKSLVRKVPDFKRIHALASAQLESLPDFLKRRQASNKHQKAHRPPFTSPRYETKTTGERLPRKPLVDHANVRSLPQASRKIVPKQLSGSDGRKPCTQIKRSVSHVPPDSAFARRKAYDLTHSYSRVSMTPKRSCTNSSQVDRNTITSNLLGDRILSSHALTVKEKSIAAQHDQRQGTRERWFDSRRGLPHH